MMKRAILFSILFAFWAGVGHAESPEVRVFINGTEVHGAVLKSDGVIQVPPEEITRALGSRQQVTTEPMPVTPAPMPPVIASTGKPAPPSGITTIKGKLTYHYNVFDSNRADPGAQVWLVSADQVPGLAAAAGGTDAEPIGQRQSDWDAKLTSEYHFPRAVADGAGNFYFEKVAAGEYLLVMQSKHANGLAGRDRKGKFRFQKITVSEGQTADASFNFGVTAYRTE